MIRIIYHPDCLKHNIANHPESAARLEAVYSHILNSGYEVVTPEKATLEQVGYNHTSRHIEEVRRHCEMNISLDADTPVCADSFDAALLAAGGAICAVDHAINEKSFAFALIRPPGHHALSDRSMGFCLFNNIAIAAQYAKEVYGLSRILIIDWDVHHGNGTQASFYDDSDVLYFSTHHYPHYPGTGWIDEVGEGDGEGYTVNVPLQSGCGDEEYTAAFAQVLVPIALQFKPQLILISAGFDAHAQDPFGGMNVSTTGFGTLAGIVSDIAQKCGAQVAAVLEGGYNPAALAESVMEVSNTFDHKSAENSHITIEDHAMLDILYESIDERISEIIDVQKGYWPSNIHFRNGNMTCSTFILTAHTHGYNS